MILGLIKQLSWKEILGLVGLCLRRPAYVLPTIKATKNCISLCDEFYGKTHHLDNRANAVRHVLWNLLIAKYCIQRRLKPLKVMDWTNTITDWHEQFSINPPLQQAMDLHNNAVGRNWLSELGHMTGNEIMHELILRALKAKKVGSEEEIPEEKNIIVYIED
ncbi:DUF6973 domain-containing protein [Aureitalea marina]|uniref:DUF6973 domain-containing protein n=1 Tax=Aureitalea marina TaxID=930804 RepID=A0A2S7KSE4_9FLAO|nr:hypothetical protein [Aureitalea marina]PQB05540.1 hypothetical protein BST85_12010 [Aureitalea marina]